MTPPYSCKACGLAVILLEDGGRIWACEHRGTIVANCDAVVTADGGVAVAPRAPVDDMFTVGNESYVRFAR